jgi:hypothetical protein
MLLLAGGAGGLPFADDVGDIIDGVMQRLGYNWSTKQKRQELLDEAFGAGWALPGEGRLGPAGRADRRRRPAGLGNLVPAPGVPEEGGPHARTCWSCWAPRGTWPARFKAGDQATSGKL